MEQSSIEQLRKSIVNDYTKGYRVDSIIKSIPTDFIKKNERKQFVYEVIYNYLISQKSVALDAY